MRRPQTALRDVLASALRLGLTSFGGPIAHIGYFRREYVDRRGWVSDAAFADLVALCQSLPGPASSELGIAIGTLRAGRIGGLVAWLGFTLPSAIALTVFALITPDLDIASAGWAHGLRIAAVAIVAAAVVAMWRSLAADVPRTFIAILATVISLAVPSAWTQIALIVGGGVVGWTVLRAAEKRTSLDDPPPISRWFAVACLVAFAILLVGLPAAEAVVHDHGLALTGSLDRAGSLVFGGGHVVLPLLHASVVEPGWVTDGQFLAGYGAAQAVPGPLFTFAAFLGAIEAPAPNGLVGAAIALIAIFTPAFLLTWGTLPFWHRLRQSSRLLGASAGVNAAVVGILLAALYMPVWTSAVDRPVDGLLALAGLLLLVRSAPPWLVVILSAIVAQLLAIA